MSNLAVIALARLVQDVDKGTAIANNWKLSNAERNQLIWTIRHYNTVDTIDRVKYLMTIEGVDRQWITDLLISRERYDLVTQLEAWEIPTFPVNGNDMIDRGFRGPEIGAELARLKGIWAGKNYSLTRSELLELIVK